MKKESFLGRTVKHHSPARDYPRNSDKIEEIQDLSDKDKWLIDTLQKNKDVPFVKRILNTNYEPLDMGTDDEGRSMEATHLMSYSEADGKFFVYPEVVMGSDGQLKKLSPEEAWQSTQNTGNRIVFEKESEAKWFSKNYKRVWGDSTWWDK